MDLSNLLVELGIDPKEYQSFTDEEKEVVNKIILEKTTSNSDSKIINNGNPSLYESLYYADYDEIPVDFETFITSDEYIGKATRNGNFLYPFWREEAKKILNRNDINEVALSGCLSGDTLIPLIDGTSVTIKELSDSKRKNFKVYSYDLETNMFTVGNAVRAFSTGFKRTYTVTFDNGNSIRITGNHKFLTRDKHYKSINDGLKVGDSIMPFNTYIDANGYEVIYHPQKNGKVKKEHTHKMSMRSKVFNSNGTIHHKDYNKRNNLPENLLKTTRMRHLMYHVIKDSAQRFKDFNDDWRNGRVSDEIRQKCIEGHLRGTLNRWADPKQREAASIRMTQRNKINNPSKAYWSSEKSNSERVIRSKRRADYNKENHPNVLKLKKISKETFIEVISNSYSLSQVARKLDISQTGVRSLCNRYGVTLSDYLLKLPEGLNEGYWLSRLSIYNKTLSKYGEITDELVKTVSASRNPKIECVVNRFFDGNYDSFYETVRNCNHKIVSIVLNDDVEEVYDIEVDKYHNFALGAGIVVHNSIGIGKSSFATIMMAYHLYKTMCLKDPQAFFGLSPGSKIVYCLINNTLASSYGVGFEDLQKYLIDSPWFLKHGRIGGRDKQVYIPDKGFEFLVGSRVQHTLGRHIICLTGDTVIKTIDGNFRLDELLEREVQVYCYNSKTKLIELSKPCVIKQTGESSELIEIEFEDNSLIRCTPDHKFMMVSGEYKEARSINNTDIIMPKSLVKRVTIIYYSKPVKVYDVINSLPYHNFLIKTNEDYIVSSNCALMDEVSFAPGQSVNYESSKIMRVYQSIRVRMETRFTVKGHMYGLFFLVSSKATESSFLEAYIADQVKKGYPIYVVDQPLWKVKPQAYSGKTFKLAVGNKYLRSKIVADKTEVQTDEDYQNMLNSMISQGYRILDVPIEHKQSFDQDMIHALQDVAGISTSVVTKPFNYQRIIECIKPIQNPFYSDIITVGTDDDLQYQNFFDATKIPDYIKGSPIFLHLDASVSGDKTGLAGVAIVGSRQQERATQDINVKEETNELIYQTVFTVAIQAPSDSQISFDKTRQFIYYLKDEVGLNIKHISTDNFQSYDTRQILASKGFDVGYTSLDRTPYGYDGLKLAINEKRFYLLEGCQHVIDELTEIEKDNVTLKWDHPVGGCFPANQLVQTDHGIKYIVDLDIEKDKVLSYNIKRNLFSYTKFRNLRMTKTVKELCKVSLKFNRYLESSFTCTLDHPILLSNNQYIEASNLKQGNILQSCSNYTVEVDKVEIIISKKPIPVYDIEVPKHNNFVLDNGVVVHNSKDTSDALAGAYLDASQYKDEFMFYHPAEFEYEDLNDNSTSQEKLQRGLQDSFLKTEIQNAIKSVKGNKNKDDSGSIQRLNKDSNKEDYEDYLDSLLDSNILFL